MVRSCVFGCVVWALAGCFADSMRVGETPDTGGATTSGAGSTSGATTVASTPTSGSSGAAPTSTGAEADTSTGAAASTSGVTAEGSTSAGSSGETTGAGTTGSLCEDDGYEPNDDEASALMQANLTCPVGAGMIAGVLSGMPDVDWYRYFGEYQASCLPDVKLKQSVSADTALRLCVFVTCKLGGAEVQCQGSTPAMSPGGAPGCCDQGDVEVVPNCPGTPDESMDVYLLVDGGEPDVCTPYTLEYSYEAM